MYLEKLKNLVVPPAHPIENSIPANYINEFGFDFPQDYIDLISLYGTGSFGDFLMVYNPYSSNKYANIFSMSKTTREQYINYKQLDEVTHLSDMLSKRSIKNNRIILSGGELVNGIGYPFDFFPNIPGLIPWGEIGGDFTLFWKYEQSFKEIVVYNSEAAYSKYSMTVTEFLYKLFTEQIGGVLSSFSFPDISFIQFEN